MKRLIITSGIVVALAGCSSLGLGTKTAEVSPTPPVKTAEVSPPLRSQRIKLSQQQADWIVH